MKNIFPFPVKFQAVSVSMNTLQDFLRNSYNEKKEWLTESINFFKDLPQMEEEFRQELTRKNEFVICLEGEMFSEKDILSKPMEENY